MYKKITKERFEELLFEQKDSLHGTGTLHGYKLSNTSGGKTKNFLFIKINGITVQLTIGDKAFKKLKNAINGNTLEE